MCEKSLMVTFIRHGHTRVLGEGRIQHPVEGGLSDLGRMQAEATKTALSQEVFSRVLIANSERARETAGIVLGSDSAFPIRFIDDICERNYGFLTGKTQAEAVAFHEDSANPFLYRPEGGESLEDAFQRACRSIRALLDECFSGEYLLFFGHGTIWKCALMALSGIFPNNLHEYLEWESGGFKNCSITKISIRWGKDSLPFRAETFLWNDVSHLTHL